MLCSHATLWALVAGCCQSAPEEARQQVARAARLREQWRCNEGASEAAGAPRPTRQPAAEAMTPSRALQRPRAEARPVETQRAAPKWREATRRHRGTDGERRAGATADAPVERKSPSSTLQHRHSDAWPRPRPQPSRRAPRAAATGSQPHGAGRGGASGCIAATAAHASTPPLAGASAWTRYTRFACRHYR